jgi:hypothetical protein
MMFYTYRQNNSGGSFIINDNVDQWVIIEAPTGDQADLIADDIGIYFGGVGSGRDCDCCGDRWYPATNDGYDVADVPTIYGKQVTDLQDVRDQHTNVVVHYLDLDGSIKYGQA